MNKYPFNSKTPVLGFCAFSGTGKTTLLKKLIPALKAQHLRLAVIKHAHHEFDVDQPGKDSYELRKSGADQMLISSARRWVLMRELGEQPEPGLDELVSRIDHSCTDLILVEGFKRIAFSKIELHRPALGKPPMYPKDQDIIAVATDAALELRPKVPQLDLNNIHQICRFVTDYAQST